MLHDKVDFHIRRRVRWVPSDASTSIDEFEICAHGRSQPDAGDIVVPYVVIDILILLLTQVFHSYTPHGCCPKDYVYSIHHHQIAQGRCRLTSCLTTKSWPDLLLLELLETSPIQCLQLVVVVIFKDLIKFIHPRLCGHRCPDYSRYPMSRHSRGSYSTSPPLPDISSSHSAAFAGLARRPGLTEVSLVHHPAHDISGTGSMSLSGASP